MIIIIKKQTPKPTLCKYSLKPGRFQAVDLCPEILFKMSKPMPPSPTLETRH